MISAILLAGGKSSRMGRDKAFLDFGSRKFVYRIARELLDVSDDVMVIIGGKDQNRFVQVFDSLKAEGYRTSHIRVLNDQYALNNPLGGMLTGFVNAKHDYSAIVGCDMPLLKGAVLRTLAREAEGFDCAVPIHENYDIEPLCGVYQVRRSTYASLLAIEDGKVGPKHMVSYIPHANYVPVSYLRLLDPSLESLLNVNYPSEYEELLRARSKVPIELTIKKE
jgi:molybdopterin-guanine dinucleotide biosynthesis protein A